MQVTAKSPAVQEEQRKTASLARLSVFSGSQTNLRARKNKLVTENSRKFFFRIDRSNIVCSS